MGYENRINQLENKINILNIDINSIINNQNKINELKI